MKNLISIISVTGGLTLTLNVTLNLVTKSTVISSLSSVAAATESDVVSISSNNIDNLNDNSIPSPSEAAILAQAMGKLATMKSRRPLTRSVVDHVLDLIGKAGVKMEGAGEIGDTSKLNNDNDVVKTDLTVEKLRLPESSDELSLPDSSSESSGDFETSKNMVEVSSDGETVSNSPVTESTEAESESDTEISRNSNDNHIIIGTDITTQVSTSTDTDRNSDSESPSNVKRSAALEELLSVTSDGSESGSGGLTKKDSDSSLHNEIESAVTGLVRRQLERAKEEVVRAEKRLQTAKDRVTELENRLEGYKSKA